MRNGYLNEVEKVQNVEGFANHPKVPCGFLARKLQAAAVFLLAKQLSRIVPACHLCISKTVKAAAFIFPLTEARHS